MLIFVFRRAYTPKWTNNHIPRIQMDQSGETDSFSLVCWETSNWNLCLICKWWNVYISRLSCYIKKKNNNKEREEKVKQKHVHSSLSTFSMSPSRTFFSFAASVWCVKGGKLFCTSDNVKEYINLLRWQDQYNTSVSLPGISDGLPVVPLPRLEPPNSCQVYIWSQVI